MSAGVEGPRREFSSRRERLGTSLSVSHTCRDIAAMRCRERGGVGGEREEEQ